MSLWVSLEAVRPTTVFDYNITHNLSEMAEVAGIYRAIWHPEDVGITTANQLIAPLIEGLLRLKEDPQFFKRLNPENGWGSYDGLVLFVERYLNACMANPDAKVSASR